MSQHPITIPEDYVKPEADSSDLVGVDGNAFSIIGFVSKQLRHADNSPAVVDAYREQAMAGDYDHLLRVSMVFLDGQS